MYLFHYVCIFSLFIMLKNNIENKQADCSLYFIWWQAKYVYLIFFQFQNFVSYG